MVWYKKDQGCGQRPKYPFALHQRSSSLGHYFSMSINLLRFKVAEVNICT